MGAFNSLLSGFATTAGSNFKEQADEKRKRQDDQDKLVSAAIQKELETNDQLDQQSHEALSREYYKRMGVPNAAADQLVAAHNHLFDNYNAHKKSQQATKDAAVSNGPQLQGDQQTSAGTPTDLGTIPGQQLPQTAALPNIPPPPYQPGNPTVGDLKFAQSEPQTAKLDQDRYNAAREAQRAELTGSIEDKIAIHKKYAGTPMEKQVDTLLGMIKGGAGAKATMLPATMDGKMLKARLKAEDPDADVSGINDDSSYKVALDGDKTNIVSHFEVERATRAGTAALGSAWIKMFPEDKVGNPVNPDAMYVPIRSVNGGGVIGVYPVSELGSAHASSTLKTVQMKDGTTALVPVTETSTTTKTVNGRPVQNGPGAQLSTPDTAQVAPPVPPVPGAGPAPAAPPQAQALPTPQGGTPAPAARPTPGQPLPRQGKTAASAQVGAPIPIPGAGKALTPKEVEDNNKQYQALSTTANRVQEVLNNADLFKSLASSGKIQMAMSPSGTLQVVSRYSSMNDRERHVAALLTSLKEDINTLRGVYQATGFRGPEAFAALTSLAGKPLGDPGVTIDILKQTLESLQTQKGVIEQTLTSHNLDKPTYTPPDNGSPRKNPFRDNK